MSDKYTLDALAYEVHVVAIVPTRALNTAAVEASATYWRWYDQARARLNLPSPRTAEVTQ